MRHRKDYVWRSGIVVLEGGRIQSQQDLTIDLIKNEHNQNISLNGSLKEELILPDGHDSYLQPVNWSLGISGRF